MVINNQYVVSTIVNQKQPLVLIYSHQIGVIPFLI